MTAQRRRRGRPLLFTDTARKLYLDAITSGAYLQDAARIAGIHPDVAARHTRTDRELARAVAEAREAGRRARTEQLPHDEYRYNHHACRCTTCCTAATKARAGRRHDDEGGQVIDLPPQPAAPLALLPLLSQPPAAA